MKRAFAFLIAGLGAGCSVLPGDLFQSAVQLQVQEVWRSMQCQTPGSQATVQLFDSAASAEAWRSGRGIEAPAIPESAYALVELGTRNTGGHGLAISRSASLQGEVLVLYGTFISPGEGDMTAQVLTAPCVLVQLPAGRYDQVEVRDQSGEVRARGSRTAPAAGPAAQPAQ